jgi:proline iminopeptidase
MQSDLMIFMIRCQVGGRAVRLATMPAVPAVSARPSAALYPVDVDHAPLRRHHVATGDGHVLAVEEWGAADGVPALVLHGGPGSGCTTMLRRFFDPARYRIVCPDQRGAGRSLPAGDTHANTTVHLLADLRLLRSVLDIERWLVVGGSWGATLALAHAVDAPDAVSGLLLRGSFLARPSDIEGFFADAPAALAAQWPVLARLALGDAQAAALVDAWARHELRRAGAAPLAGPVDVTTLAPRYRIQSHYLQHGCWLQSPPLLDRCGAIPPVPTLLLHGAEDRICRPDGALALHERMPHAALRWAHGAGHDPAHPAMVALMVQALDRFAAHGHFGAVEDAAR